MNFAGLAKSPRLQRVHELLADGRERSTLEIAKTAKVCAVNSCISELRENGAAIECRQERRGTERVWLYRMVSPAPAAEEAVQ